jgi:hypothetical protein
MKEKDKKRATKEIYSTNLKHDEEGLMTIATITSFYNKSFKDEIVENKDLFVHNNQHNTMSEGKS